MFSNQDIVHSASENESEEQNEMDMFKNDEKKDNSSLDIHTLNVDDLHEDIKEARRKEDKELRPAGSYISLYLLFFQRFLHEMMNFTIIPCVFELSS